MGNSSISERIEELVLHFAGGNKSKFAAIVGTSEANIRNYIEGRQPKFDFLSSVAQNFEINYEWLLTGRGEMLCKENTYLNTQLDTHLSEKEVDLSSEKSITRGITGGEILEKNADSTQRNIYPESNLTRPSGDIVNIPIVEISVAAGDGYYNGDTLDVIDSIQLPQSMVKRGSQYFCVRVKGESMAPTLLDSSFLVIRLLDRSEWEYMPEEQVYVVTDRDGKAYVKRVKNRLDKGFIVCMSDNPDKAYYPNFNLQADEIHTIWHAEWYISAKMPNIHQTYYTKVSQLEDDMAEMRNDIAMLKKLLKH